MQETQRIGNMTKAQGLQRDMHIIENTKENKMKKISHLKFCKIERLEGNEVAWSEPVDWAALRASRRSAEPSWLTQSGQEEDINGCIFLLFHTFLRWA